MWTSQTNNPQEEMLCRWNGQEVWDTSSIPRHNIANPMKAGKLGRIIDHDHTLLARPQLVPQNNETGNITTKKFPTLRVDPVECSHKCSNPQGHEGHQAGYLEAPIAICDRKRIEEGAARKIKGSSAKGTREKYQWIMDAGVLSVIWKGYPYLKLLWVTWWST